MSCAGGVCQFNKWHTVNSLTEDFQDFIPYDRAYSEAENLELMSLLYATY